MMRYIVPFAPAMKWTEHESLLFGSGIWRKMRDSNPRAGYPTICFPGSALSPLGQSSIIGGDSKDSNLRVFWNLIYSQAASASHPCPRKKAPVTDSNRTFPPFSPLGYCGYSGGRASQYTSSEPTPTSPAPHRLFNAIWGQLSSPR